jgi:hypothetical protein
MSLDLQECPTTAEIDVTLSRYNAAYQRYLAAEERTRRQLAEEMRAIDNDLPYAPTATIDDAVALLKRYANWFDHHPAFFDAITGQMREDAHTLIARVAP